MFDDIAQQASKQYKLGGKGKKLMEGIEIAIRSYRGGLWGVLDNFRAVGLGHIAATWVDGQHPSEISPDDLDRGMGSEIVTGIAAHAGLTKHISIVALTYMIPRVINKMTPGGRLPDPPPGEKQRPLTIAVAEKSKASDEESAAQMRSAPPPPEPAPAPVAPPATAPPVTEEAEAVSSTDESAVGDIAQSSGTSDDTSARPNAPDAPEALESEALPEGAEPPLPPAAPVAPLAPAAPEPPAPPLAPIMAEPADISHHDDDANERSSVNTHEPIPGEGHSPATQPTSTVNQQHHMDTPHLNMPSSRIEPNMQILKGMLPVILIAAIVAFTAWRACEIQPRASHPYGHEMGK